MKRKLRKGDKKILIWALFILVVIIALILIFNINKPVEPKKGTPSSQSGSVLVNVIEPPGTQETTKEETQEAGETGGG